MIFFLLYSVNVVHYMDSLCILNHTFHCRGKSHLVTVSNPLNIYSIWFASILLRLFASVFIRDVGMLFSYGILYIVGVILT